MTANKRSREWKGVRVPSGAYYNGVPGFLRVHSIIGVQRGDGVPKRVKDMGMAWAYGSFVYVQNI
jgi:hypothetical protein